MSGGATEAKASKVEAAASLGPLFVARGYARKGESLPDFLVEACQRLKLQVRRDGAHAVDEFAHAGTVAQKASCDLWVVAFG